MPPPSQRRGYGPSCLATASTRTHAKVRLGLCGFSSFSLSASCPWNHSKSGNTDVNNQGTSSMDRYCTTYAPNPTTLNPTCTSMNKHGQPPTTRDCPSNLNLQKPTIPKASRLAIQNQCTAHDLLYMFRQTGWGVVGPSSPASAPHAVSPASSANCTAEICRTPTRR
jgi:hypothetical protein